MVQLVWTNEAERWLRDIYDYIAKDNPSWAANVVSGIYEQAQILSEFPEARYRYVGCEQPVRILLYGHYRIAYLIEAEVITVLGVFRGALAIERYLL